MWKPCQEVKASGLEVISRQGLESPGWEDLVICSYKREDSGGQQFMKEI